jgi:radical SAM protein with 4Fe4S-binding SPASM domain
MNFKDIYKTGKLETWARYKDKLRSEHKLSYLFWECTMNCNFYCKHCGSSAGKKHFENELKTAEIKKVFEEVADTWNPKEIMLAVTGGEPLLRPDLFEVMGYANKLGFSWGMVTNGFLVDENKVLQMKEAGMSSAVVSIDGLGEIHDEFRGMKGAYEHAMRAVRLMAEANFIKSLQITTSLHPKAYPDLEKMYEVFKKSGANSWRIMNIDPIGRAEENREVLLDQSQLRGLLEFIKEKRKKDKKFEVVFGCAGFLGLEFEGEVRPWFYNCNTGINTASILHDGDIFVCPNVPRQPELIQGNVRKDSFVEVWVNKYEIFRDKNRTNCDKCQDCDDWDYCLGNSFHLRDFEKNEPKLCHRDLLKKK